MRAKKVPQESNAEAALIILDNPDRYGGLPMLWAEAWLKQNGLGQKPAKQLAKCSEAFEPA